jgi:hypothetical protein
VATPPGCCFKGAQESFKKFAEDITELLEKDNLAITETYFKDAICRVILFRTTEKLVSGADWYDGGYRAQTVAYSISYLSELVVASGLQLNFDLIWEQQEIPFELVEMLKMITHQVYQKITHPATGYANISQWAKNSMCWEAVRNIDIDFPELDERLFIYREEKNYKIKESKDVKVLEKAIDNQVFVLKVTDADWRMIYEHYRNYKGIRTLSNMQLGILEKMSIRQIALPSEKQAKILYQIYETAREEGLNLN